MANALQERFAGLAGDLGGEADQRPPLVLLHGLTFDRTMWRPALDELAALDPGRRTLALDLPGHGDSEDRSSYRMEEVVASVHDGVEAAGLSAPVLVGHSISGVVVTLYATRHPTSGVVNVDQPLRVEPFAELLHSVAGTLEGPGFDAFYEMLWESMRTDLLPPAGRDLVRAARRPRQEVAVGYWRDVLDRPVAELSAWVAAESEALRASGIPYLVVAGAEPEPGYREWLRDAVPQATITVFPESGHFPHLADPRRFAECLAATATWSRAT